MDLTRWSRPKSDCLYALRPKMEKLYTVHGVLMARTLEWFDISSSIPGVTGKFGLGVQNEAGQRLTGF